MSIAAVAESASTTSLWHNRLGHMSVKGMKMLTVEEVLEGLKSFDMSLCKNYIMSKKKQVSFTKTLRELKKSTGSTKQMGVEVELLNDSASDVVANTQETPDIVAEELEVKQMGVEVELLKDTPSDVAANTQETSETVAEEPKAKRATLEKVLKRSSRAIKNS